MQYDLPAYMGVLEEEVKTDAMETDQANEGETPMQSPFAISNMGIQTYRAYFNILCKFVKTFFCEAYQGNKIAREWNEFFAPG